MRFKRDYDTPLWVSIVGWTIGIILVLAIAFGLLCLEGWLVMLLWNATLPAIFSGVSTIGFWQTIGIMLLIDLLFGVIGKIIATFKD